MDIYVTGSNAKFLSKDIITEFRESGFEVKMHPLSFSEFMSAYPGTIQAGFNEYMLYGGLPQILTYKNEEQARFPFNKTKVHKPTCRWLQKIFIASIVTLYYIAAVML